MSTRIKIFIFVFILFFFGVLGAFLIGYIANKDESENSLDADSGVVDSLPSSQSKTFVVANQLLDDKQVSEDTLKNPRDLEEIESVFTPTIIRNGDDILVYTDMGIAYKYANGSISNIFSFDEDVSKMRISPRGDALLVKSKDGFNFLVDIKSGERTSLPNEIRDFAWSPDGTKIVYQYFDVFDKNYGIFISNPDASGFEKLVSFDENDDFSEQNLLFWPSPDIIVWQPPSLSLEGTALSLITLSNNSEIEVPSDGTVQSFIAANGKILYTILEIGADGSEGALLLKEFDIVSGIVTDIDMEAIADNCTYVSNNDIVCAVSDDLLDIHRSEILVKYVRETKKVEPLTKIDPDTVIEYAYLQYLPSTEEIVYINNSTKSIGSVSLK